MLWLPIPERPCQGWGPLRLCPSRGQLLRHRDVVWIISMVKTPRESPFLLPPLAMTMLLGLDFDIRHWDFSCPCVAGEGSGLFLSGAGSGWSRTRLPWPAQPSPPSPQLAGALAQPLTLFGKSKVLRSGREARGAGDASRPRDSGLPQGLAPGTSA